MSEALNVTKAAFGGLREVATAPLWQYDYGQILKITGLDLPQAFEVHFSNSRKSGETVTQIGTDNQVTIPDMYLTSGADIYCFIFLHDGLTDGETEYVIKIPVRERPEPSDIEPTPEQQDAITEAIAALNSAVEQTSADVTSTDASARAAAESAETATEMAGQASNSAIQASDHYTAFVGYGNQAIKVLEDIQTDVNQKASEALGYAIQADQAKTAAEAARDSIKDMTASAHTLPSGSSATVTKTEGETTFNLDFGIPKGEKGDKGDTGATGAKGEQGKRGPQGIQGERGPQGPKGDDYTLTEQDKQDIADLIPVPEAGGMVVTATLISGTLYSVDKTYAEIGLAVTEGSNVVFISDGKAYPYAGMMYFRSAPVIAFGSFFAYEGTLASNGFIVTMNGDDTLAQKIQSETAIPTLSDVQINGTSIVDNGVANVPIATTTQNGAMSAQDKERLDNVYADYSSALTALGVI